MIEGINMFRRSTVLAGIIAALAIPILGTAPAQADPVWFKDRYSCEEERARQNAMGVEVGVCKPVPKYENPYHGFRFE
ncbi:hypothetical protein [Nocardia abscessus]|uniref:hypothetical protein n=1 Tax=Nocardia abscessus TaxID=120957 RepID=UPI002455E76B|nr:hypothetical protein [Nocardia abscessus]